MENKLEKVKSVIENMIDIIPEMKEAIEMIISHYGGVIDVNELSNEYNAGVLYITYDGGNHPEYESTIFNEIYSLYIKNEEVIANTDFDELKVKNLQFSDLIEIFMWLYETHKDGKLKEWVENNK